MSGWLSENSGSTPGGSGGGWATPFLLFMVGIGSWPQGKKLWVIGWGTPAYIPLPYKASEWPVRVAWAISLAVNQICFQWGLDTARAAFCNQLYSCVLVDRISWCSPSVCFESHHLQNADDVILLAPSGWNLQLVVVRMRTITCISKTTVLNRKMVECQVRMTSYSK